MSDRLALIIANSEYNDPKLARLVTPSHDAEALAKVLGDPAIGGFEVTLLVNQAQRVVLEAIACLYQYKRKGDLLLLYYSGHGIKDEYGTLYLAVKDTKTDIVSATAISAAFVRDQLDKSSSQRKVVVLDCCHSGAFAGTKALGSSVGTREAFAGSGYGRVILTASNAVEFAWEGDQLLGEAETSVFTRFLVEGLQTGVADRDGDGMISLDELYDYAYEQVITSGRFKQTPQKWAQKVEGQIIIARNPRPMVKPAELLRETDDRGQIALDSRRELILEQPLAEFVAHYGLLDSIRRPQEAVFDIHPEKSPHRIGNCGVTPVTVIMRSDDSALTITLGYQIWLFDLRSGENAELILALEKALAHPKYARKLTARAKTVRAQVKTRFYRETSNLLLQGTVENLQHNLVVAFRSFLADWLHWEWARAKGLSGIVIRLRVWDRKRANFK